MGRDYKVHLDGYNLLPTSRASQEAPRKEFLYWTDDGDLAALRFNQWKLDFLEQRAHGFDVWQEPFVPLRLPKLFTCAATRSSAPTTRPSTTTLAVDRVFLLVPAQASWRWLQSFKEFPPRQKPASFSIDQEWTS